jgi:trk system potassium uptake protein
MLFKYEIKKSLNRTLDIQFVALGIASFVTLLILVGFKLTKGELQFLHYFNNVLIAVFAFQEIFRIFIAQKIFRQIRNRIFLKILSAFFILNLFFEQNFIDILGIFLYNLDPKQVLIIYLGIIQIILIFAILVRVLRRFYLISKIKLHTGAIFAISFAILIIFGALLLQLPKAAPEGKNISFVDALFTSTSAVCVTGLVVLDTENDFSPLGKLIIMCLIQAGGLGVMTLTTFLAAYFAGGISVQLRIMMKDLLSHESLAEVKIILLKILLYTFVIESTGALLLYFSLNGALTTFDWNNVYIAVFHSISAFCNAGFSLFSGNLMDPVVKDNYFFSTVIMLLIVFGGLGFIVISELSSLRPFKYKKKRLKHQLSLHSKIVIISTLTLIFGGGLLIYILEPYSYNKSISELEALFHSIFLSVTARTAGFNTVPVESITVTSAVITVVLMWIGASPGSTGGGIKTTTASISLYSFLQYARGKTRVELFGNEIHQGTILKAFLVIFASLLALGISSIILFWLEPNKQPIDLIFEATSALGTVGLSRNVSFYLSNASKIVIILLMYIGRIGVFTFFTAFFVPVKEPRYSFPKKSVMIG